MDGIFFYSGRQMDRRAAGELNLELELELER